MVWARCGSNSFSRCVYWDLSVSVFGMKYCFCLCVYSDGRFLKMLDSGLELSSMSPCKRMNAELFQV